jgi:hypothetical protein
MSQATPSAPMSPPAGPVASRRPQVGSPSHAVDQASTGFGEDVEEIKQQFRAGSECVRAGLSSAVAQARDRSYSVAEQQKQAGGQGIETIARAVREAANGFREQTPGIARQVDAAASGIERISDTLKETSVDDVLRALQHFARAQPLAFFLGAGLTGLLIARFIQRSADNRLSSLEHAYGSVGEAQLLHPELESQFAVSRNPPGDFQTASHPMKLDT